MKRPLFFGRHLYNQIVYPLLAASVVVGIVATIVAVYFLDDLTTRWVTEAAQNSTENISIRFDEHVLQMQREAKLCAGDERTRDALRAEDYEALRGRMLVQNAALNFDAMVMLDRDGRVLAAVGEQDASPGNILFASTPPVEGPNSSCAITKDTGEWAIVVFQPIYVGGESRVLAVSHEIDDDLLSRLGVGRDRAFSFYGPGHENLAGVVGTGFKEAESAALLTVMRDPESQITGAVKKGSDHGPAQASAFKTGGSSFRYWIKPLSLPLLRAGGASSSYVVGIVSEAVSQEANDTSRNLIAAWSFVAVIALVGLGGWIARRVSDPLVELAAGARRIADGDFTTKMRVLSANEVGELAQTFNTMTDSLRERSESLTKKVLELATLYEMSRSLGSTLDMDELLGSVLDSALRIFELDLGYIVLRDKDSGSLALRALRGVEGSTSDGAVRSSMSEWVVREGRPLIFNPDASSQHGQMDTVTGAKAALCVPLISSEGTIGSITIGSSGSDYRFSSDDVRLLSTIANHVTIAIGNIELFSSLQEAYLATVRSLAAAVDAKDTYTRGHSDRVATYATMIAERMGLTHEQRIALEMAAYLHDIGKIGVREEILLKPGRLDDEEMAQMRHHPLIGANILKPVAFPWAITPVVRHHHESWDGTGYPAGLKGEEIPLLARILTVADSYEAMTADRPYREGRDMHQAIDELRCCAGIQFDAAVVETFATLLLEFEEAGESLMGPESESIAPEEARAIFAALADGVFASFRRLGGPRLSSNVEREVDAYFESEDVPFRVVSGRIAYTRDTGPDMEQEVAVMRTALRRIDAAMGRVSGTTLVDHFYTDAFEAFSGRMRTLAVALDFYRFS